MKRFFIAFLFILLISGISFIGLAEGTRDNPYSTGDNFVLEDEDFIDGFMKFEFELLNSKRGEEAYQLIKEANEYAANRTRETAQEEEKEILLAKFYAKALDLEEEPLRINTASLFDIMDSTGSTYNREADSHTNNPFGEVEEVYKGGEITGWMTFLIPEGDSPLILLNVNDANAFLALEESEEKKLINLTLNKEKYNELKSKAEDEGVSMQKYLSEIIE